MERIIIIADNNISAIKVKDKNSYEYFYEKGTNYEFPLTDKKSVNRFIDLLLSKYNSEVFGDTGEEFDFSLIDCGIDNQLLIYLISKLEGAASVAVYPLKFLVTVITASKPRKSTDPIYVRFCDHIFIVKWDSDLVTTKELAKSHNTAGKKITARKLNITDLLSVYYYTSSSKSLPKVNPIDPEVKKRNEYKKKYTDACNITKIYAEINLKEPLQNHPLASLSVPDMKQSYIEMLFCMLRFVNENNLQSAYEFIFRIVKTRFKNLTEKNVRYYVDKSYNKQPYHYQELLQSEVGVFLTTELNIFSHKYCSDSKEAEQFVENCIKYGEFSDEDRDFIDKYSKSVLSHSNYIDRTLSENELCYFRDDPILMNDYMNSQR